MRAQRALHQAAPDAAFHLGDLKPETMALVTRIDRLRDVDATLECHGGGVMEPGMEPQPTLAPADHGLAGAVGEEARNARGSDIAGVA